MKIYSREELNNYSHTLTYDDISLVPTEVSRLQSRAEADTKCTFMGYDLNLPVMSSPMDSVTGIEMADILSEMKCLAVINRFDSSLDQLFEDDKPSIRKTVSVSLTTEDDFIKKLVDHKFSICIDTANANNYWVLKKCEEIKSKYNVKVMIGNIAHGGTLKNLVDAGADSVRVGIGNGSVCTTSVQTGIGLGQVSAFLDVYFAKKENNLPIELIADGGIKSPGDVAKAIALGADSVMLGRLLAGTKETPGEVIKYNDQLWKKYRGSASFGVKMKNKFVEGAETMIPYKGTVVNTINGISDGLKSSMSYMNCMNIEELKSKNTFVLLSNSSFLERLPRK